MSSLMTVLTTKRLTLRPLETTDAPFVAKYAGDWDVASMTERIPFPYDLEIANGWVEAVKEDIVFAVEHQGEQIGCAGIAPKTNGDTELGYWFGKPWWGHGFATEAGKKIVAFAFQDKARHRIVAGHFEDNPASARVLEKIGFQPTGESCDRFCEARKQNVVCVGFDLSRARATELGFVE